MNSHNTWQVFVQDRVYEAEYEELIQWIKERSVLPEDKVRRGNLRWLNAGKIPDFNCYFQEQYKENKSKNADINVGLESKNIVAEAGITGIAHQRISQNAEETESKPGKANLLICSVHPERAYSYVCEICESYFCKTCPNTFGSNVKICINCGGLCLPSAEFELRGSKIVGAINKPYPRAEMQINENDNQLEAKLQLADFIDAFKHPFRFPLSLIISSILFAVMVFGQCILAVGGNMLFSLSVIFSVLTIVLMFSVMFKMIENSVQEKPKINYIAQLNRFTLWEDFIHPFSLGIGVYIASFGLFTAIAIGAGAYALYSFNENLEKIESETRSSFNSINLTLKSIQSKDNVSVNNENEIEEKIEQSIQKQFESVFGSNYLADTTQIEKLFKSFMRLSIIFQMPIFFAFIFGILLFPAVGIVSGSTRSFSKTLNLFRALKTIRKCGFDYIKINLLTMTLMFAISSAAICVYQTLSGYDSPLLGILLGIISGSLLFFYFWLVFSSILGAVFRRRKIILDA